MSEYTWDDVQRTFASGDWLGAVGMLGTALFLDRAFYETADPTRRSELDAELAATQRERAMTFIEKVAGALDAHFGLDIADAVSRAGAAARQSGSSTTRKAASPAASKTVSTTARKTASTTARKAAPARGTRRRGKRIPLGVPVRVVSR